MQEILGRLRFGKRPVAFVSPFIRAHDENLYWLARSKLILHAFEEVVVPLEFPFILWLFGIRAKIHLAHLRHGAGMPADHDHQPLSFARSLGAAMIADAFIVLKRSAEKQVVPGRNVQSR